MYQHYRPNSLYVGKKLKSTLKATPPWRVLSQVSWEARVSRPLCPHWQV